MRSLGFCRLGWKLIVITYWCYKDLDNNLLAENMRLASSLSVGIRHPRPLDANRLVIRVDSTMRRIHKKWKIGQVPKVFSINLKRAGKEFRIKPLIEAMTMYSGQGITVVAAPLETNTNFIIGDFLWKEPSAEIYLDIPLYKERYARGLYKVVVANEL